MFCITRMLPVAAVSNTQVANGGICRWSWEINTVSEQSSKYFCWTFTLLICISYILPFKILENLIFNIFIIISQTLTKPRLTPMLKSVCPALYSLQSHFRLKYFHFTALTHSLYRYITLAGLILYQKIEIHILSLLQTYSSSFVFLFPVQRCYMFSGLKSVVLLLLKQSSLFSVHSAVVF